MKGFIKSKKGLVLLATFVVAAAAAVGAYAYFTANGNGTGTASTGNSTAWTMTDLASGPLYSGTSSPVAGTLNNPGHGYQGLQSVTISIASAASGCVLGDFSLSGTGGWTANGDGSFTYSGTPIADVAASGHTSLPAGLTLNYADSGVSQSTCQNNPNAVTLDWSAT